MKLEHIAINVADPKGVARWYQENLGLEVVVAKEQAPFEHFLSDGAGGMIEIYDNPKGEIPDYAAMSPFTFHIALAVDDIEQAKEALESAGARADGAALVTPAGDTLLFMRDPWGVTLQLVKRARPLA